MIRVYIAAPKVHVVAARTVARALCAAGFDVRASWLDIVTPASVDPDERETAARLLACNRADLLSAGLVVALTVEGRGRETYCEIAFALARHVPVVWVDEHGGACLSLVGDEFVTRVRTRSAAVAECLRLAPVRGVA